jgi:phospholipid/cholesterol/gamma-HCH transport system ATP-binding protein
MFQSGALLGSYTVGENVALPLQEWTDLPADAIQAIVQAKLRLVGLDQCEGLMPAELSGGMKKRAAIARAMALEPDLIFLDEPSAGLDPVTAADLDELIVALNRDLGLTVVVVTHDLDSVARIGKHCIMLDRESKRIIARGDPRELREQSDDPRVKAFFHRMPKEAS